jgi:hypothetical protein
MMMITNQPLFQVIGVTSMNGKLSRFVLMSSKINRQHIQLAMSVLALALLALGIGAPEAGGGPSR